MTEPPIPDTGRRDKAGSAARWHDSRPAAPDPSEAKLRLVVIAVGLLIGIILTFYVIRIVTDAPFLASGTDPEPEDFESRYVAHPWLAYLHMTPGVLYLIGAPLQLSQRFRTRHYTFHRRLGRVLVPTALFSTVLALVFGVLYPWGGTPEAAATVLFGCWFAVCLLLGFRAIRRNDVINHRRWMIRAFAVGVGVGMIRIWIGILLGTGLLDFPHSFAGAFWIGLSLQVLAGEWWIRTTPSKTG